MADTGKQSPLGVNVTSSYLQNKGFRINPRVPEYVGVSRTNDEYSFTSTGIPNTVIPGATGPTGGLIGASGSSGPTGATGATAPTPSVNCTSKPVNDSWIFNGFGGFSSSREGNRSNVRQYLKLRPNQVGSIKLIPHPNNTRDVCYSQNNFSGSGTPAAAAAANDLDEITATSGWQYTFWPVTAGPPPVALEVNISECEGDFDSVPTGPGNTRDKAYANSSQEQFGFRIVWGNASPPSTAWAINALVLDPTKTYYINFKFKDNFDGYTDPNIPEFYFRGFEFNIIKRDSVGATGPTPGVTESGVPNYTTPTNPTYDIKIPIEVYYNNFYNANSGILSPAFVNYYNQNMLYVPSNGISLEINMKLYPISNVQGETYHEFGFVETVETPIDARFALCISPYPGDYNDSYTGNVSRVGGNWQIWFATDYWGTRAVGRNGDTSYTTPVGSNRLPSGIDKYYINIKYLGGDDQAPITFRFTPSLPVPVPYSNMPAAFDACANTNFLKSEGLSDYSIERYTGLYAGCRNGTGLPNPPAAYLAPTGDSCTATPVTYRNSYDTDGLFPANSFGNYLSGVTAKLKWTFYVGQIFSIKIPKNFTIFNETTSTNDTVATMALQVYFTTFGPPPDEYEVCLSECEGDFDSVIPGTTRTQIYVKTSAPESVINLSYFPNYLTPSQSVNYAKLGRDKDYYINIRATKEGSGGNSCGLAYTASINTTRTLGILDAPGTSASLNDPLCLPSSCQVATAQILTLAENLYQVPSVNYRYRLGGLSTDSVTSIRLPPYLGNNPANLPNNRPILGGRIQITAPNAGTVQPDNVIMKISLCSGDVSQPVDQKLYYIPCQGGNGTFTFTFNYPPANPFDQYIDPTATWYCNFIIPSSQNPANNNYGFFVDIAGNLGNANAPQPGYDVPAHNCGGVTPGVNPPPAASTSTGSPAATAPDSSPGVSYGANSGRTGRLVQDTVLRLQTWGINDAFGRNVVNNSTYDNLIYIGATPSYNIPALGNAKPNTYLPNDPSGKWNRSYVVNKDETINPAPANTAWTIPGIKGQAQGASWFPYNSGSVNKSITQWGYFRLHALQAWNEFNYNSESPTGAGPEYKDFCSSFLTCDAFKNYSNQAIYSIANSTEFDKGFFSGMNNLSTGEISGVNSSLSNFGSDLEKIGKAIDLRTIDKFGYPSNLLRNLAENNALDRELILALTSVNTTNTTGELLANITNDSIQKLTAGVPVEFTVEQEKLIYSTFLIIKGNNLLQILRTLNCTTFGTTNISSDISLADLLSVKSLFPNSYNSMTVSVYNSNPSTVLTAGAKSPFPIYNSGSLNSAINTSAFKDTIGEQIPQGEPPIVDTTSTTFTPPPKGFGGLLQGIIPTTDAVAAGAFSYSMKQIKNINQVNIETFAQVVKRLELPTKDLPQTTGTATLAVNETLANQGKTLTGLGGGYKGSYTMSDMFGCMSSLPYNWEDIFIYINQLAEPRTSTATPYGPCTLYNVYQQNFLAITWQKAFYTIEQPTGKITINTYQPPVPFNVAVVPVGLYSEITNLGDTPNWMWNKIAGTLPAGYDPTTQGQSSSAVTIGTGTQVVVVPSGMIYSPGDSIVLAYDGNNYMIGTVTTYTSSTSGTAELIINVTTAVGEGTYDSWQSNLDTGGPVNVSNIPPLIQYKVGDRITVAERGEGTGVLNQLFTDPITKKVVITYPARYKLYYDLKIKLGNRGGGYGRGGAPGPVVTIPPDENTGDARVTPGAVGINDFEAQSNGRGNYGRITQGGIDNGRRVYYFVPNVVDPNFPAQYSINIDDVRYMQIYSYEVPSQIVKSNGLWAPRKVTISTEAPPIATLPIKFDPPATISTGVPSTNGGNVLGDIYWEGGILEIRNPGWPQPMNGVVQSYINQANSDIQRIYNSFNGIAAANNTRDKLNVLYDACGTQLMIEQRTRFIALPPVPVPRDEWLNLYPTAIYAFVDSLPSLQQDTGTHMSNQTLEAIADLTTPGGQSEIAMGRQERNQARLNIVGVPLDNNITGTISQQDFQTWTMNGTINGAINGISTNTGTFTIPAWPSNIDGGGNPIIPVPTGRYVFAPTPGTITIPGEITPLLTGGEFPQVGPIVTVGPSGPGRAPTGNPLGPGAGGGDGSGLPNGGAGTENPTVSGSPYKTIVPANLDTVITSSTTLPADYTVQEAIDEVVLCNCDCFIT